MTARFEEAAERLGVKELLVVPSGHEREDLRIARGVRVQDLAKVEDRLSFHVGEVAQHERLVVGQAHPLGQLPVEIIGLDLPGMADELVYLHGFSLSRTPPIRRDGANGSGWLELANRARLGDRALDGGRKSRGLRRA